MDDNSQRPLKVGLYFFALQVILNWVYCSWIKSLPTIIENAWFVVMPLIFYFYFAFAVIAAVGLYARKFLGFILACCVLMFGCIMVVVSYLFIFRSQSFVETLVIPLVICNLCVVFYLVYHQSFYKNN